jgi:hypothetical protein
MKDISTYREMTENPHDNSVKDFIGFHFDKKERILSYFNTYSTANAVITCMATDYITGEKLSESVKCFDDGIYLWTNEEVHLFKKYDLKLNDDFIEYVLSKQNND